MCGTPGGKQFALGSSPSCDPSARSAASALAQGWYGMSSALRSAARFTAYLLPLGSQIPDRSGWPSGVRGAGADRFGLPSGPRGIERAGTFTHCAYPGVQIKSRIATDAAIPSELLRLSRVFIFWPRKFNKDSKPIPHGINIKGEAASVR